MMNHFVNRLDLHEVKCQFVANVRGIYMISNMFSKTIDAMWSIRYMLNSVYMEHIYYSSQFHFGRKDRNNTFM